MADTSVAITAGSGTNIRAITGVGTGSATAQQVVTLGDSTGALLGTTGAPLPVVLGAGTVVLGKVIPAPSTTGTLSSVAGTVSASTTILALNTARLGAVVFNDSTAVLYLSLASTCTTTSFTVQVPAGGWYELPTTGAVYTGILTGVWASATGNARVTELT